VEDEIAGLIERMGRVYEREMVPLILEGEGEVGMAIAALEEE